jgi:hypothetical protein
MKRYLYECSHPRAGTWGMLLPWNVKPEWPGVKVRRILPTIDEVASCVPSWGHVSVW